MVGDMMTLRLAAPAGQRVPSVRVQTGISGMNSSAIVVLGDPQLTPAPRRADNII